ncbi:MAG TPA: CHRD domain-containing protein [Stellaceae bacterium]|nr:CHRD domain-containing protein [Stellaceae bacterium]
MQNLLPRPGLILLACLTGIVWSGLALASPASFKVALNGAQEVPTTETGGTGSADITYDPTTRKISWSITYSGLSSPVTMAHIHGPAAPGKTGPVIVWLSVQGVPPASPITGETTLTPEQATELAAGQLYVNVHTRSHPAGEIRGQVVLPKG